MSAQADINWAHGQSLTSGALVLTLFAQTFAHSVHDIASVTHDLASIGSNLIVFLSAYMAIRGVLKTHPRLLELFHPHKPVPKRRPRKRS